ncbi:hypothetical protein FA13DRAFT_1733297 [Coprinellus micaceus]|uniref:Phosphatidic acid phosphatase type 2/haloperoxidase domain-containing protein n=1 Tax=Coprinellus micaceus TaxID=71717 RepID=A0A4Y7T9P5_COPMI|nr:hypothetical protein FA13DRAFT_1733297 [Coprinellus micaceus]
MASYAALAVQTREYLILVMWTGQLAGEALNLAIKHLIKQERPIESFGNGYGFPSSHSQYMAYFSTFLMLHLYFRHRFSSTGITAFDSLWRGTVYSDTVILDRPSPSVRYYLGYHNFHQIFWGLFIGSSLGAFVYSFAQLLPTQYPNSVLGRLKRWILSNSTSTWVQLRDGWDIWADAGRESEWLRWRNEWEKKHAVSKVKTR